MQFAAPRREPRSPRRSRKSRRTWTCGRGSPRGPPCPTGSSNVRAAAPPHPISRRCPPAAKAVVESDEYRALSTSGLEETLPFRRWALICERTGDRAQQAEALLQAAWAADDAAVMTDAARLRTEVAALWDGTEDVELGLRRLDVLRRAGLFDQAAAWAKCWPAESRRKPAG